MRQLVRTFLTGFAMGSADIVPGVSGGTIAFIVGIYQQLIEAIKTVTSTSLRLFFKGKLHAAVQSVPWQFLVPLGLGILTAILTLTGLIEGLLVSHPVFIWSFFFGLVIASIVVIARTLTRWDGATLSALLLATVVSYLVTGLVGVETPATLPLFFVSGAIAICAMILPGVSGSFLLVVLGKYRQVLAAIHDRELLIIAVFMAGAVIGLASFARVVSYLFKKFPEVTTAALLGFMVGALRKVWPWKETLSTWVDSEGVAHPLAQLNVWPELGYPTFLAIGLMLLGCVAVLTLERVAGAGRRHGA